MAVTGVLIGASILKGFGILSSANAEASSLMSSAMMQEETAKRISEVTKYNLRALEFDEKYSKASYGVEAASRGVIADNSSKLDIAMEAATQRSLMINAANFEIKKSQDSARSMRGQAGATRQAGLISAIGGGILDIAAVGSK